MGPGEGIGHGTDLFSPAQLLVLIRSVFFCSRLSGLVARRSHAAAVTAWPLSLLSDKQYPAGITGKLEGASSPAASMGCLLRVSHLIWSLPAYSRLGGGREGWEGIDNDWSVGTECPGCAVGSWGGKGISSGCLCTGNIGNRAQMENKGLWDWGGSWKATACPTPGIFKSGGSRTGPGQFLNPSSGLGLEGKVSSAWLEAENAQLCRIFPLKSHFSSSHWGLGCGSSPCLVVLCPCGVSSPVFCPDGVFGTGRGR